MGLTPPLASPVSTPAGRGRGGPGWGGCRLHPPALLKPQPRKKPRSSGASPIRGLWSGVKDSERKGDLSSLQVRTPGAAPPERAATEAGSARASFSQPAPSSRPSSGPPPPGSLPGCFCHLPPELLGISCQNHPAGVRVCLAGSRGASQPSPLLESPLQHVAPHPQHHLLAVTLPVTLAHWTVSARWAGTGLGSLPCPTAQHGAQRRQVLDEGTNDRQSFGREGQASCLCCQRASGGGRDVGGEGPSGIIATAGLGSHGPGLRPHFAPS